MELSRANTNKLKHCEQKEVLKTQLAGGRSIFIGYKQNKADELRLGWPRTRPVNKRVEGLNPAPTDYHPSAQTISQIPIT